VIHLHQTLCTLFANVITNSTSSLQTQVDESPFITVLCKKCHCHHPLKEARYHAQNCTHVVKDPAAKDFHKQFPQVEASAIALEYTLKQCKLSASDMRPVAYGHALNDKVCITVAQFHIHELLRHIGDEFFHVSAQ